MTPPKAGRPYFLQKYAFLVVHCVFVCVFATERMSVEYLQVAEDEGEEPIELPTEDDGTLLLSTLSAQFPGSSGLKFRNPETKAIRGVRLSEGRLHPPSEIGWGSQIFCCVFPKGWLSGGGCSVASSKFF